MVAASLFIISLYSTYSFPKNIASDGGLTAEKIRKLKISTSNKTKNWNKLYPRDQRIHSRIKFIALKYIENFENASRVSEIYRRCLKCITNFEISESHHSFPKCNEIYQPFSNVKIFPNCPTNFWNSARIFEILGRLSKYTASVWNSPDICKIQWEFFKTCWKF